MHVTSRETKNKIHTRDKMDVYKIIVGSDTKLSIKITRYMFLEEKNSNNISFDVLISKRLCYYWKEMMWALGGWWLSPGDCKYGIMLVIECTLPSVYIFIIFVIITSQVLLFSGYKAFILAVYTKTGLVVRKYLDVFVCDVFIDT